MILDIWETYSKLASIRWHTLGYNVKCEYGIPCTNVWAPTATS